MRSPFTLAAVIVVATAAIGAEATLPPMSVGEKAALVEALKKDQPATATIACAGTWCEQLGADLQRTFVGQNWKVERMDHGGLGIDGVPGVRIHPCGDTEKVVAAILPTRRREVIQEACGAGDRDVFIILGR